MEKECQHCKKAFTVQRIDSVYCSRSCRQLAYMQRKDEREKAEQLNSENGPKQNNTGDLLPVIRDQKPVQKPEPVEEEYQVFNSKLLDNIRQQIDEDKTMLALHNCIRTYQDLHSYWVGIRLRCLVECVLLFSETKFTPVVDLMEICNAFTLLQKSMHYQNLPSQFPYKLLVKELREKLKELCIKVRKAEQIKFRIGINDKTELIVMRYGLAQFFAKEKFSQLNFE